MKDVELESWQVMSTSNGELKNALSEILDQHFLHQWQLYSSMQDYDFKHTPLEDMLSEVVQQSQLIEEKVYGAYDNAFQMVQTVALTPEIFTVPIFRFKNQPYKDKDGKLYHVIDGHLINIANPFNRAKYMLIAFPVQTFYKTAVNKCALTIRRHRLQLLNHYGSSLQAEVSNAEAKSLLTKTFASNYDLENLDIYIVETNSLLKLMRADVNEALRNDIDNLIENFAVTNSLLTDDKVRQQLNDQHRRLLRLYDYMLHQVDHNVLANWSDEYYVRNLLDSATGIVNKVDNFVLQLEDTENMVGYYGISQEQIQGIALAQYSLRRDNNDEVLFNIVVDHYTEVRLNDIYRREQIAEEQVPQWQDSLADFEAEVDDIPDFSFILDDIDDDVNDDDVN